MRYGVIPETEPGPTLGSLEHRIMMDTALSGIDRQMVLAKLRNDVRGADTGTPLRDLVRKLGGGLLGYLVAKYFGMSPVGQTLATLAGYGIGKTMNDFYRGQQNEKASTRFRL